MIPAATIKSFFRYYNLKREMNDVLAGAEIVAKIHDITFCISNSRPKRKKNKKGRFQIKWRYEK